MKKIVIFAAAALMMSSCSLLQKSSTPAPAATATTAAPAVGVASSPSTAGLNAGTALLALYKQYQIDGKFNASNLQNIANAAALIANCQELKANYADKEYRKQFNQGLLGSAAQSIITPTNVNTVSNSLVNIATAAAQTAATSQTATAATQAANTAATAVNTAAEKASSYAQTAASAASTVASAASSITSLLSLFGGK